MKELSTIAESVKASTTMAIDSLFKQMKADGIDVISFGAGEPDFNTPEFIKEAGISAIEQNCTKYTPAAGSLDLRQAICNRVDMDTGVSYQPEQVIVTSGAKHAVYISLRILCNPGDEIIIPGPAWVSYFEMVKMVGAVPILLAACEKDQFKVTPEMLEKAITPRTKAIILNNPSNPSGMLYSREELQKIAEVCIRHDLYVISDEIYCSLVYDGGEFVSFASLGDEICQRCILINGVSKSYAMTGWRIGYACANRKIAKAMANYLSHSTGSPCSVSQRAAYAALTGLQDEVELMRQAFESRRNYIVERINRIQGVSCLKPQGAFYIMMNLEKLIGRKIQGVTITDGDVFADQFLKKGLVAVVPCSGFGADNFVRWSYSTSMENIKEGMARLEQFLNE